MSEYIKSMFEKGIDSVTPETVKTSLEIVGNVNEATKVDPRIMAAFGPMVSKICC